jgi:hypothetical protein
VIDAVLEEEIENLIGLLLGHTPERGGAEDDAAAVVTGSPEG